MIWIKTIPPVFEDGDMFRSPSRSRRWTSKTPPKSQGKSRVKSPHKSFWSWSRRRRLCLAWICSGRQA